MRIHWLVIFFLFTCQPLPVYSSILSSDFQQDEISKMIKLWETTLQDDKMEVSQRIETLIQLAAAYQEMGNYPTAYSTLQRALEFLTENNQQRVTVYRSLGDVALAMRQFQEADSYFKQGLEIANALKDETLIAQVLNSFGNLQVEQQDYAKALNTYQQVTELAKKPIASELYVPSLMNQMQVQLKQENWQQALSTLQLAITEVNRQVENEQQTWLLLNLGHFALRLLTRQPETMPELLITSHTLFNKALQRAEHYQHQRFIVYAKGYLGQVYEYAQRYPEALQLTREAIFLSQAHKDLLYLWEWQQGRLLQKQKNLTDSATAYRRALGYLHPFRSQLAQGHIESSEVFQEYMRPIYYGLADNLLQQATPLPDSKPKTELLKQAREVLESLKVAELQDYFQDECVTAATHTGTQTIDSLDEQTAVLYPIILSDRIELLVSFADHIYQQAVDVNSKQLKNTVLEFRRNLQTLTHYRFIEQAKQLYQWLIVPILKHLQTHEVNTLIVVPDGILRLIPMAALFDAENKEFLVQQFALGTTPTLDLVEPEPLPKKNITVLLNGLSEGVQNFSPLPNVSQEISALKDIFPNRTILLDQQFLVSTINQALQTNPYSIIHIASHAQFNRDPHKTFILTYEDKITMDNLQKLFNIAQFRQEHVELLTLSACQTALGDERAALGLAGMSIKAGVRSAVASLWSVNDESTAHFMVEFYQQLQEPALSRAQALQKTQQTLLKEERFRHPIFWSPFLLIGSWL